VIRALAAVLFAVATAAQAADVERGRALYEGRIAMATIASSPMSAACSDCHRPSGMGNFEGGLAVPPIAGPMLFKPLDRDTGRFFAASSRWRVRPAYDEAALGRLLRNGVSPDGVTIAAAMPRYRLGDTDLADLSAYLRQLSDGPPPGLDAGSVRVATITTPDADPARRDAMLTTLQHFVAQKNGQSRHEAQRSAQSSRTREMVMYRKFRVWQLEHWALQGEPSTWGAQLDEWQSRRPVYALVAGMGVADWSPVDAFCARRRLPCLLPLVDAGGGSAPGFYSLHYHAGIDADATLAARRLKDQGVRRVALWGDAPALAARVRDVLQREGLAVDAEAAAVVSLLPPAAHAAHLRGAARKEGPVAWLPGTHALGAAQLDAALALTGRGWIVTPMRSGELLDRQLERTRLWLRGQGLGTLPADVAASALQAATVLGEGLVHLDFGFTPEYLLELLEHGLENVIPWSPYPRLAIGPEQRIASKGSWVGEVRDGRIDWQWAATP
jgi:mono/diheme cytochrome c family protein